MSNDRAKLVRQSCFKVDGTLTSQPVKNQEQPQLENQGDLLLYAKEQDLLKRMEGGLIV